ncbi:MAG: MlaD family protein [Nautiliaceae bacterium]
MKTEIKVGIFIFLGLVSLMFLTFQVNSLQNFNKKGYYIYAVVNDASGLNKKAKVKMKGVIVGDVEDLSLVRDGVKLKLFIQKGVEIPSDSLVTLTQDNFLGGRYVKIIPGNSEVYLQPKGELTKYLKVASLDDVMNNFNEAVNDFRVFMRKANKLLDKKSLNDLKETVSNIKDSSIYLKKVLNNLNVKLPKLLKNANDTLYEYKKIGMNVNKKLPSILNKTDSLFTKLNKVGLILNSELKPLLKEYTSLGRNANDILTENNDSLKKAIKKAEYFFARGGDSFKKLDNYLGALTKSQILVDIQSNYMLKDDYFKTSAYIAYLPVPTKYYILGITSTKDYTNLANIDKNHQEDKVYISAEYGKRFDNLMLRGGIIQNTGGLGFDYFIKQDRLVFSGDIYDFNAINDVRGNNPHLDLKAAYTFLKHIQLIGGVDNILNVNARTFFLGVGVKFKDNDLKTILSGGATSFLK